MHAVVYQPVNSPVLHIHFMLILFIKIENCLWKRARRCVPGGGAYSIITLYQITCAIRTHSHVGSSLIFGVFFWAEIL